jgi:methionine synthase II (cobalamin-independent)
VAEVEYKDLAEARAECELLGRASEARDGGLPRSLHDRGIARHRHHHHAERVLQLARELRSGGCTSAGGTGTVRTALEDILPILYQARVGALSLELANPRHSHEYQAFERHPLPDSMVLIPGVVDVKTNVVEHPEVVAERIMRAVAAVGDRTRVIAGTDCGPRRLGRYLPAGIRALRSAPERDGRCR